MRDWCSGFLIISNPQKQGIDFDLIGLSYYPDGKNTLAELQELIGSRGEKYGKPIVIAETAFPANGTAARIRSYTPSMDGHRKGSADSWPTW